MRKGLVCTVAALMIGGSSASAAQTPSWVQVTDAPEGVTAATAQWPSGISMIARCMDERGFDLMMTLAQPIDQDHVAVTTTLGDDEPAEQRWLLSEDGARIFARQPGNTSRALIQERPVRLVVAPENGPRHRYELEAPDGPRALADVMEACDLNPETVEEPEETSTRWVQRPTGEHLAAYYPEEAKYAGTGGTATIECVVQMDGTLRRCLVESVSPEGEGFGQATLALSQYFRLAREGGFPNETFIQIPIRWQIGEPSSGGRIR